MPGDVGKPIDYAPAPPLARRRRVRRRLIVGAVALLVAASAPWWGPVAWRRTQILYWQHRCATYVAPSEQVAHHVPALRLTPRERRRLDVATNWLHAGYLMPEGLVPEPWARYYQLVSPPGLYSQGTLFLHRRQTPRGAARLLALDVVGWDLVTVGPPDAYVPDLRLRVFRLDGFAGSSELLTPTLSGREQLAFNELGVTLRAGQPDADDASHFTIAYDCPGGESGVIDGWLRDDNSVVLERRERSPPPTTTAASGIATRLALPSPERSP